MRQLSGGIRHSQRRGQTDTPEPSQSCTSPAPPPPHMSFSPAVAAKPRTFNMCSVTKLIQHLRKVNLKLKMMNDKQSLCKN
ncbi:hypothetical protein P8452_53008 [Trifolium repens]|nr:hypothetical protein P8452_53008 [Trifolium repens]